MPKSRFNEIKDVITRSNESRLMTSIAKKENYTEKCRQVARRYNQWKD